MICNIFSGVSFLSLFGVLIYNHCNLPMSASIEKLTISLVFLTIGSQILGMAVSALKGLANEMS